MATGQKRNKGASLENYKVGENTAIHDGGTRTVKDMGRAAISTTHYNPCASMPLYSTDTVSRKAAACRQPAGTI